MSATFFLGCDVGVTTHPSAIALLRLAGEVEAGPVLAVHDMALATGAPFEVVADEVQRVIEAIPGGPPVVGVDGNGPGQGVVQVLRKRGVRVIDVKASGQSAKVHRRPGNWSVPATEIYEVTYRLLAQGRLLVPQRHPLTARLVEEMDAVEATYTTTGNVKYDAHTGGGHGDLLTAVGIAALLHEVPHQARVAARTRANKGSVTVKRPTQHRAPTEDAAQTPRRERPTTGRRRRGTNTARQIIEQRRAESEDRWYSTGGDHWRPMGIGTDSVERDPDDIW